MRFNFRYSSPSSALFAGRQRPIVFFEEGDSLQVKNDGASNGC